MKYLKKVLIIKMSALGDVVITLPHIQTILAHHSNDPVWLMTSPPCEELFVNHPRLQTVRLDRNAWFGPENAYARILWVRRQRFDVVYDLQGNRISRLLVRFSKSPRCIGTQPRQIYHFHPEQEYRRDTQQNVYERLNETIISAGLKPADPGAELYAAKEDIDTVEKWKKANWLLYRPYVLLHAGSSREWPSKRWPEAHFAELAVKIEKAGLSCIWIGGNDEMSLNRRLAGKTGLDATNRFNIVELYLLGRGARFALTNDSGPMHILTAAGIPVFSFFGPTSWVRSHAAGQSQRTFHRDLDCSPCFLGQCPPENGHACLEGISPEEVWQTVVAQTGIQDGTE